MGCHTWFFRPLKDEERSILRNHSSKELILEEWTFSKEKYGDNADYLNNLFSYMKDKIINSFEEDSDDWIILGNFKGQEYIKKYEGKLFVDMSRDFNQSEYILQHDDFFHDVFRVMNYPNWIIHNMRELRRKMGKKYFDLTEEQITRVSYFFKTYPGGIITFG